MFNSIKRFRGNIRGVNIHTFLNQLDNNLTQTDRVKLVKQLLYTQNDGKSLDAFFEVAFEQKDIKNGVDYSHIKLCLSKADNLSSEDYTCTGLERLADYMLYAPDGERINKKTKYNFYPKGIFEDVILRKEDKIGSIINSDSNYESDDEIIDFLIREGRNFKKTIEQKIFQKDIKEIEVIAQYQVVIDKLTNILKSDNEVHKLSMSERKKVGTMIRSLKDDQTMCKNNIKGAIYFKQPLHDSTVIDYDQFDFGNIQHVIALLKVSPSVDFNEDLACLVYDLQNLCKQVEFEDIDKVIMNLWRDKDSTQESIADVLKVSVPYVNKRLKLIATRIAKKYWEIYEDWYYLNVAKGTYKKCSKCGEVKLISHFSPDKTKKDGLKSICKECRKIGTK